MNVFLLERLLARNPFIKENYLLLNQIYYIFISTFILLTRRKATVSLIHRASNYSYLLPEMPKYSYPLKI